MGKDVWSVGGGGDEMGIVGSAVFVAGTMMVWGSVVCLLCGVLVPFVVLLIAGIVLRVIGDVMADIWGIGDSENLRR